MPDKTKGPFLTMAVFCDRAIEGKDGVISVIRIVDRVEATIPSDADSPAQIPIVITLVLGFRAGNAQGTYNLKLEVEGPTDKPSDIGEVPVSFQGPPEQGANIISTLQLLIKGEGLYWFNIYLEGEFITRVPLRVVHLVSDVGSVQTPLGDKAETPAAHTETQGP